MTVDGVGSAAPTPRRALDAEDFLSGALDGDSYWDSRRTLPASLVEEFGAKVASASAPIDDVRGTAPYRRHALSVMARRCLGWAWNDYVQRKV